MPKAYLVMPMFLILHVCGLDSSKNATIYIYYELFLEQR